MMEANGRAPGDSTKHDDKKMNAVGRMIGWLILTAVAWAILLGVIAFTVWAWEGIFS